MKVNTRRADKKKWGKVCEQDTPEFMSLSFAPWLTMIQPERSIKVKLPLTSATSVREGIHECEETRSLISWFNTARSTGRDSAASSNICWWSEGIDLEGEVSFI